MPYSFDPFPVLETQRLRLRKVTLADAPELFEMRSDPHVMQYIPRPLAQTVQDVEVVVELIHSTIEKGEGINWLIEWKETGSAIGLAGFVRTKQEHNRAEVGYSLNRKWHRRGIMREALRQILSYGFNTMKLHSVEAIVDAENQASAGLLESAGFAREAYFREDFYFNGRYRNSIHFGMLETEFRADRGSRPQGWPLV